MQLRAHIKRFSQIGIFFLLISSSFLAVNSLEKKAKNQLQQSEGYFLTKKSFVSEALQKSGPAIVTIETSKKIIPRGITLLPPQLLLDPYIERFFNNPLNNPPKVNVQKGQGSGFIFSNKGLVLTNAHVIENSEKLIIGLSDGRRVNGQVIGQDYLTDVAVIKLNGYEQWPVAKIGDSETLTVGDWAIAVGNPYGLEKTVTLGIISNLNRNVSQLGIANKRIPLIQTDAAINPGNSGGPLLNAYGEVVGINTLIRTGPGAGLGFAIPINEAIRIANQLAKDGKAIHPIIGVSLTYLNQEDKEKINYSNGAKIINILPKGPAEKKGLKVNDVIIKVNSKEIKYPEDVITEVNRNGINKKLSMTVLRRKNKIEFLIKPIDIYKIAIE